MIPARSSDAKLQQESRDELVEHIRRLEEKLAESEETLQALRSGEVDAIVASGPGGDRIYTLKGADAAYRQIVEEMTEGAVTLAPDGLILFSNQQFARLLGMPLEQVIGSHLHDFIAAENTDVSAALHSWELQDGKAEVRLQPRGAPSVPAYLSWKRVIQDSLECVCLVVTDLSEQRRNEEIVSAAKLARSILEQAADAMLVTDPSGRIILANHASDRLAGVSVLMRNIDEVFQVRQSSDSIEYAFREILSKVEQGVSVERIEATVITPDGRPVQLLLVSSPLAGSTGELLGCIISLIDITERKEMEQSLRESEERFRTLVSIITDVPWTTDGTGCFITPQPAWTAYTGQTWDELRGFGWLNMVHPEDRRQIQEGWQRACNSRTLYQSRGRFWHAGTQEWRYFEARAAPILDAGGSVREWVGACTDVNERKKAEAERGRLAAIVESSEDAIVSKDLNGVILSWNGGAERLFGYTAPEAIGQPVTMLIPPGRGDEEPSILERIRRGKRVEHYETIRRRKDGTLVEVSLSVSPIVDEHGRVVGGAKIARDITERRRMEKEGRDLAVATARREMEAELARVARALSVGELATSIAHEVNQPLAAIVTNAEAGLRWLKAKAPKLREAQQSLESIVRDGNRASEVIHRIREFLRKGSHEVAPLDLNAVVQEAIAIVRDDLLKRKIALLVELSEGLPTIRGDRVQLQQVILSLIMNGSEAMASVADGSRELVVISQKSGTASVLLAVRDSGAGIEPENLSRMFDAFFTTKPTGMGLGLSISRSIIEAHGGRIGASLNQGPGLTVHFTLPIESRNP